MISIELQNLKKFFFTVDGALNQTVIDGISLAIRPSESVAFMGPSGSGKSTLLNLIAGLEEPSDGQILLGGKNLTLLTAAQREKFRLSAIAYVFQFFHLLPTLTALENCCLVAIEQAEKPMKDIINEARALLSELGLEEAQNKMPAQLSGGMQARVALARALMSNPKVVLADEPTGNLDSVSGEQVLDVLFRKQRELGFTLLLVTHDELAANRAQRIVRLRDGKLQS
ncbi:ABC transporter ATP-binding protein [bacterium]|nr:ABC transporter ATP-binding protein [bacterium]